MPSITNNSNQFKEIKEALNNIAIIMQSANAAHSNLRHIGHSINSILETKLDKMVQDKNKSTFKIINNPKLLVC